MLRTTCTHTGPLAALAGAVPCPVVVANPRRPAGRRSGSAQRSRATRPGAATDEQTGPLQARRKLGARDGARRYLRCVQSRCAHQPRRVGASTHRATSARTAPATRRDGASVRREPGQGAARGRVQPPLPGVVRGGSLGRGARSPPVRLPGRADCRPRPPRGSARNPRRQRRKRRIGGEEARCPVTRPPGARRAPRRAVHLLRTHFVRSRDRRGAVSAGQRISRVTA